MTINWSIQQTDQVELDLISIYIWTADKFSSNQADEYIDTVTSAIQALVIGPDLLVAKLGTVLDQVFDFCMCNEKARKGAIL